MDYGYIENFKNLGFGMFVHFGLYSLVGKGEWYLRLNPQADAAEYEKLTEKFAVKKTWAKELVSVAKEAGCRYITLTARHHDGFSLFDTCGLSDYDAPHSASGRDLIKEFVEECRKEGVVPFLYHTLADWHNADYMNDFPKYIDYLVKSVGILCKNYGKIGGLWFDGMWDKPDDDWQEDRLYGTIRKYQSEAMIINNSGLSALGKVGHKEIDGATFERGKPAFVARNDKPIAGEMCQVLNDHWGYAEEDCNYKSVKELLENLVDCRKFGCNFLLNTGIKGDGSVNDADRGLLCEIGKWIRANDNFIYRAKPCGIKADGADILFDGESYYAVIKGVPMSADPNVQRKGAAAAVKIYADIKDCVWLDGGEKAEEKDGKITVLPFPYGKSYSVRVLKFRI